MNHRSCQLPISPQVPPGFLGNVLTQVRLLAVAHVDHPLHQHTHALTYCDMRNYRHIVVRDSGSKRDQRAVTVEVDQRWTVSQIATSIDAVSNGYGFAWLPEEHIRNELALGVFKPLSLQEGAIREIPLYLIVTRSDFAGPGVQRLAAMLKEASSATRKARSILTCW
ncbi:MAG: substrate-binding domain-containing protein [Methylomicrobium sp.]|nr:substrate-binding domain-containing protein [Methylomicrobium sp.]